MAQQNQCTSWDDFFRQLTNRSTSTITKLVLQGKCTHSQMWAQMHLVVLSSLEELSVQGSWQDCQYLQNLSLVQMPKLKVFKINVTLENQNDMSEFVQVQMSKVTELQLQTNSTKDFVHFSSLKLPSLSALYLQGNKIDANGLRYLKSSISRVANLHIRSNELGVQGISALASFSLQNLRVLDIGENRLGYEGIKELQLIDLSQIGVLGLWNNDIGDTGMLHLSQINFPKLQELRVERNNITVAGIKHLKQCNMPNLAILGLSDNDLGSSGAQSIIKQTQFPKLVKIFLQDKIYSAEFMRALQDLAPKHLIIVNPYLEMIHTGSSATRTATTVQSSVNTRKNANITELQQRLARAAQDQARVTDVSLNHSELVSTGRDVVGISPHSAAEKADSLQNGQPKGSKELLAPTSITSNLMGLMQQRSVVVPGIGDNIGDTLKTSTDLVQAINTSKLLGSAPLVTSASQQLIGSGLAQGVATSGSATYNGAVARALLNSSTSQQLAIAVQNSNLQGLLQAQAQQQAANLSADQGVLGLPFTLQGLAAGNNNLTALQQAASSVPITGDLTSLVNTSGANGLKTSLPQQEVRVLPVDPTQLLAAQLADQQQQQIALAERVSGSQVSAPAVLQIPGSLSTLQATQIGQLSNVDPTILANAGDKIPASSAINGNDGGLGAQLQVIQQQMQQIFDTKRPVQQVPASGAVQVQVVDNAPELNSLAATLTSHQPSLQQSANGLSTVYLQQGNGLNVSPPALPSMVEGLQAPIQSNTLLGGLNTQLTSQNTQNLSQVLQSTVQAKECSEVEQRARDQTPTGAAQSAQEEVSSTITQLRNLIDDAQLRNLNQGYDVEQLIKCPQALQASEVGQSIIRSGIEQFYSRLKEQYIGLVTVAPMLLQGNHPDVGGSFLETAAAYRSAGQVLGKVKPQTLLEIGYALGRYCAAQQSQATGNGSGSNSWVEMDNQAMVLGRRLSSFKLVKLDTFPRQGSLLDGVVDEIAHEVAFCLTLHKISDVSDLLSKPASQPLTDPQCREFCQQNITGLIVDYSTFLISALLSNVMSVAGQPACHVVPSIVALALEPVIAKRTSFVDQQNSQLKLQSRNLAACLYSQYMRVGHTMTYEDINRRINNPMSANASSNILANLCNKYAAVARYRSITDAKQWAMQDSQSCLSEGVGEHDYPQSKRQRVAVG